MNNSSSSKKIKASPSVKYKNQLLFLLLAVGLVGTGYEAYQYKKISEVNHALLSGEIINNDNFPFNKKFADAYHQGETKNYKIAIQGFGQLAESAQKNQDNKSKISSEELSKIQFNIGNNLFRSGLQRLVSADGTFQNEAIYAYTQAKTAYEQALKINPKLQSAKFNLSLLLSIIPENMKPGLKEQSGMEVSNLPQGLP